MPDSTAACMLLDTTIPREKKVTYKFPKSCSKFVLMANFVNATESADDKLTLVQVMAFCHHAKSHYMNPC